jgi:Condensation domain
MSSLAQFYAMYDRLSDVKKRLFPKLLAEERIDPGQVAILPQPRSRPDYPVSSAQARVFFFEQLHVGTPVYNIPSIVRLGQELRIDLLRQALRQTVDRHETLRLGFELRSGLIRQIIHPSAAVTVGEEWISEASGAQRTASLQRRISEFAQEPFDLKQPPLLRALALHADDEHYVVFVLHHLVADALSVRILAREAGRRCRCLLTGETFEESPLPIQYVDYALWEQAESGLESRRDSLKHWLSALGNELPRLKLPTDFTRPNSRSHRGAVCRFAVDGQITTRLREFARTEGVTLFVVLLAAYKLMLGRIGGTEDIPVAVPMSGRNRPELEELFGYFGNTVLFRTRLQSRWTVGKAIAAVQETVLNAHAGQNVPFEDIVAAYRRTHPRADGAMYDVMFEFLDFRGQQHATAGSLQAAWDAPMSLDFDVEVHTQTAKCDLFLCCWESGNELSGIIEYDTDLFGPRTIATWVDMYTRVLGSLPENRERAIGDLSYED